MTALNPPLDRALADRILSQRQTFSNVTVFPTQAIHRGSLFQGGPLWPRFAWRVYPRHCHHAIPIPQDRRPAERGEPEDIQDDGIWCGPVMNHYGHMIADFGMRIASSAHAGPACPLVFSLFEDPGFEPHLPFWAMLDHLGVARGRIILARRPTRFRTLHVDPQAERRHGGRPSARHLDLMDRITAEARMSSGPLDTLFVSRSRFTAAAAIPTGQIAGEAYLDEVMAEAGILVVHPETLGIPEQIDLYGRARRIVFSEGSALHTLQLMGRLDAEIVVLARRPGQRVAASSLRPRVRSLRYIEALAGLIHGCHQWGKPYRARGIAPLDERRFLAEMRAIGLDLSPHWRGDAYRERRDRDVRDWMAKTHAMKLHPDTGAMIEATMRATGFRFGHPSPRR